MKHKKFDLDDITIVPAVLSKIRTRKEIDILYKSTLYGNHLPLIVSPMDTVIDNNNVWEYDKHKLLTCSVRKPNIDLNNSAYSFISISLEQFLQVIHDIENNNYIDIECNGLLIDIANGHMETLFNAVKLFKDKFPTFPLMIGNIANPQTYELYCKILNKYDFIRISVGSGAGCTTASNTGIYYPMGSLIKECYEISCNYNNPPKIVADGGFKNYDDIIKALCLGCDYIMLGSILAKSLEACGDTYWKNIKINKYKNWFYKHNFKLTRKYRGMSTKEVQKLLGKTTLTTAEGISKKINVEYTLDKWIENFQDYLRSAMSYCNAKTLREFNRYQKYIYLSTQSIKRYKK